MSRSGSSPTWPGGRSTRRTSSARIGSVRRAGLPHFRLYDLRHTYASLLLAAGAPITYVSTQLGHANPTTTLRYYAKWIPTKGQRWVTKSGGMGDGRSARDPRDSLNAPSWATSSGGRLDQPRLTDADR